MSKFFLAGLLAVGGLAVAINSASACNPKTDPSCNRQAEVSSPAPCDPKIDPSCN